MTPMQALLVQRAARLLSTHWRRRCMSAYSHINIPVGAAQALLVRQSARLLKRALAQTDERSKLEGEVIGSIDVIKCSAWEVSHSRNPRQTIKN